MDSGSVQRSELHHRQIDLRFFSRSDGLYEIEACLLDTKTLPFKRMLAEADMPPGTPLHDIVVRLVIDGAMQVHDTEVLMRATPFQVCRGAAQTLAPLKGLHIGVGWNKRVRELLGGAAGCTHIVELLGAMASTAFQGLAPQRLASLDDPANEAQRRAKVDSCFAYAAERDVVARLWPALHRPRGV